ncbi:MAG: conjugal transfer protein TraX [Erysipelotrichaceae bacterium]|jgi:hypothetical protein|nr:conjugal transfer protein TraX [Erysipelotrichaceae bacterium]
MNKNRGLDAFSIKLIAILAMSANHISHLFGANLSDFWLVALYSIGGITFPIMAFFLNEGFRYTRNLRKYEMRLCFWAILSFLPFCLAFEVVAGNVLFTLLLGLLVLDLRQNLKQHWQFIVLYLLLVLVSGFCDWPYVGVVLVFLFARCRNYKDPYLVPCIAQAAMSLTVLGEGGLASLMDVLFLAGGALVSYLLLKCYNGQKGRSMGQLFYAYYPLHLVLLILIACNFRFDAICARFLKIFG